MRKLQILIFLGFISVFASRCSKNDNNPVPYSTVDIYVHLSDPIYVALNSPSNYVYVDGGVRGIVLYAKTNNDFVALERNCTYQSTQSCATVQIDKTSGGTLLVCNCCKSKFRITDGSVNNGPASLPLKHYITEFDEQNRIVHIHN